MTVDPRLARAVMRQLELRRVALEQGSTRIGWKLGMGARERIGGEIAVGHLTSASQLDTGATYEADQAVDLRADAEVAVELGDDLRPDADDVAVGAAIAGYAAALEIVDLGPPDTNAADIVAANIFHRAFALGPTRAGLPAGGAVGSLSVNGAVRAGAASGDDFGPRLLAAARVRPRSATGSAPAIASSPARSSRSQSRPAIWPGQISGLWVLSSLWSLAERQRLASAL